ncbi:MAG: ArdC-like ssDNA-binding domain-containing protein [Eubacteriales bacterium]|nr:ArdC-like ssDNA-binding domain-containing protein [Eubacteriales bacterium]
MIKVDDIVPEKNPEANIDTEQQKAFDMHKWSEEKQQTRKHVYDLIDSTAESVFKDSQKFRAYLDVQSRFDRYSINNALLITAQKPKATHLKDFNAWKEAGTPVKKEETSIYILEPGDKYTREDGSVGVSMNVKRVFDISQTSAESTNEELKPIDERLLLKALISRLSVDIEPVDEMPNPQSRDGALFDAQRQKIYVKRNLDTPQLFRSLAREIALSDYAADMTEYARPSKHFKAVCVSYMLCKKFVIDTRDMIINLPASYANKTVQEIREDLNEIRNEVISILARMSRTLEQNKNSRTNDKERQDER